MMIPQQEGNKVVSNFSSFMLQKITDHFSFQDPNKIRVEESENSPPIIIRSGCAMFPRFRYIRCCIVILLIIIVCVVLINQLFPYPLHASCIIKWYEYLQYMYLLNILNVIILLEQKYHLFFFSV